MRHFLLIFFIILTFSLSARGQEVIVGARYDARPEHRPDGNLRTGQPDERATGRSDGPDRFRKRHACVCNGQKHGIHRHKRSLRMFPEVPASGGADREFHGLQTLFEKVRSERFRRQYRRESGRGRTADRRGGGAGRPHRHDYPRRYDRLRCRRFQDPARGPARGAAETAAGHRGPRRKHLRQRGGDQARLCRRADLLRRRHEGRAPGPDDRGHQGRKGLRRG